MIKVGFLGTGNMGGAIIRGIAAAYKSEAEIYAYDLDAAKLAELEKQGVKAVSSEGEICDKCKYVFLAIKPQVFDSVLPKLSDHVKEDTVIVSIAAGITEEYIMKTTKDKVHTVIVMPNTPFLLGEGATALAKGTYTTDEEFEVVKSIFSTGGIAEVVPMDKMKEIIAINGSSPAFIYLYAKGFIDYAKENGMKCGIVNCMMGGNYIRTPEQWKLVLDEVPGLGIKYDPSHSFVHGGDKGAYLKEGMEWGDKFVYCHVKGVIQYGDSHEPSEWKNRELMVRHPELKDELMGDFAADRRYYDNPPAGIDSINWRAFFAVLYQHDYDGYLAIEPHSMTWQGEKGEKGVKYTIKYIRDLML